MEQPILDKVADLLLDAICVVDAEGRFVFVSKAGERIFGYTQEEVIGRNMIDFVWPGDRERTLQAVGQIMAGESKTHFENRYVRKDGRLVDIMWSARWSEPDGLRMAVARDITELKRAERVKTALYEISEAAHTAQGLPALYRYIHRIIGELLPADNFFVARYDSASETLSYPYFVDQHRQAPEPHALGAGTPIAEVIRAGQALLVTSAGPETPAAADRCGGCLDWLGVPLQSRQGVTGAVVVQTACPSVRYTPQDKELLQFVSHHVANAIERKQAETRLRHMAGHDPLTDLPNRRLFHDRLSTALKRARRDQEHVAVLCLDLDGFKQVNDTCGHEIGDLLLCQVAQRLVQCIRGMDTVGRMGGDEFTVLLANIGAADGLERVAEKIRAAIAAPFDLAGRATSITVSVGGAMYPEQGDTPEQLLRQADAAMYAAKITAANVTQMPAIPDQAKLQSRSTERK